MKRAWIIIVAGLLAGAAAYCGLYYTGTARCRSMACAAEPELAWLKEEFHLSDAEFARISRLHESYLAGCAERCRRIDEKSEQIKGLLAATNTVTPEIEAALFDAARLRAECQKEMLRQFFEVSKTMPAEQGRRYLAWVRERTVLSSAHSQMRH